MTRDELAAIALRYDTLVSDAMLRALGVQRPPRAGKSAARVDRHRGARKLMRQRHGVRGL